MIKLPENMPFSRKILIVLFFPYTIFMAIAKQIISIKFGVFWTLFFCVIITLMSQLNSEEVQKYLLPTYLIFNVLTYSFIDAIENFSRQTYIQVLSILFLFISLINWKLIIDYFTYLSINNIVKISYLQITLMTLTIAFSIYVFVKLYIKLASK